MRPTTGRLHRVLLTLAAVALLDAPELAAQDEVPAEFHGDWVPATATCESPARFRVMKTQMMLINGADSETYGDIGVTYSYWGPEYTGISVVSIPEFNGDQPFTVFFNADDQKDVTKLWIYEEMQGVTNPQVQAIQAAAKALQERFPLGGIPLKKCALPAETS